MSRSADLLRGKAEPQPAAGFLQPIDTGRIARTLELDRIATENGHKNLPPADIETLDGTEQKITQQIESEWTWHGNEFINHLRAYATRLLGYSIEAELNRLKLIGDNTLASLRAAHHRAEAELGPLLTEYREHAKALHQFKERHSLERPARDPTNRWTTFGLLIFILALESMLNGFFFAKGSEFGLIGGIGTAIGISVTNVGIAFLVGLFPCRWVTHRNYVLKLLATLLAIMLTSLLITLHAFAAHFRDATALVGEEQAMGVARQTLLTTPWALNDISSYYLFGLGIIFGSFALWKGYTFDDPYPAYGGYARRARNAREAYSEEHDALFDELGRIKDETVGELENGITRIPLFPQQAAAIRAQRAALLQTFRAYESAVESAANQLLGQYRTKNREIRTESAPPHFNSNWRLPHSFLSSAEVQTLLAEPTEPPVDVSSKLEELRQQSKEILHEYESLITKFPHATRISEH